MRGGVERKNHLNSGAGVGGLEYLLFGKRVGPKHDGEAEME